MNTSILNKFGKVAGWNTIVFRLFGRDVVGITNMEYSDTQEVENVYGAGAMPIGQGDGKYEAKASFTLTHEEKINILDSLPAGVRIQDIDAFDIVVSYDYKNRVYTDIIRNVRITSNGVEVSQGDKTIAYKYELVVTHIDWNV